MNVNQDAKDGERAMDITTRPLETTSLDLTYLPPYDWDAMLAFLAARAIPGLEVVSRRRYARAIAIGPAHGVLTAEPIPGNRVRLTVRFPDPEALPAIVARVTRIFDLAADPSAIDGHLGRHSPLAPLVAARPGLRVPGAWDGFELAVRAVLGQQITVSAATSLAGRLVREFGEPLPAGAAEGLTHVFPTPERLENANIAALGMPRSRAATLSSLAAAVRSDPTILTPRRTLEEAITQLRSMSGVGEWTAQYIAMRGLREPDAFPATDIGLLRATSDAKGRRPTPTELLAKAEKWRPWRAYAALHLWTAEADSCASTPEPGDRNRRAA
jgi:AraC family transcriptional regulator, regulatory protein of adaptative response / DNA-3-methyladenine glycosylase II